MRLDTSTMTPEEGARIIREKVTSDATSRTDASGASELSRQAAHMGPLVSQSLMDATWQRVGASSPAQILQLQKRCGKEQEELAGFVIAYTSQLRHDATGLALYAHVVISEAFRQSRAKFRKIKPGKIMRTWEAAQSFVIALRATGRPDPENVPQSISEPAVFNYILGALSDDQGDPIELSEDEYWHTLCVLKVVSDCLHDAQKSA